MIDSKLAQQSPDIIMQAVIDLAQTKANTTSPNPCFACIIINHGQVVGSGVHTLSGQAHAEQLALAQAGKDARGSTVYVNLEPCCHQGKTPPCTDALINAGVKKVVIGCKDPNPLVNGAGIEALYSAGIDVQVGLLEAQAKWLNRGFFKRMHEQKPWLLLKSAATLDGRTADQNGQSKWITSKQAREQVQHLRAASCAVITGIETVLADNPSMNVRLSNTLRQPYRIVLDSQLRLPLEAKIIGNDKRLIIFTLSDDFDKINNLEKLGVNVIQQTSATSQLDLQQVVDELGLWQFNRVLIEAGQTLSGAFIYNNLVDELCLFYAGSILGNQGKSMFAFEKALAFEQKKHYQLNNVQKIGDDIMVQAINQSSLNSL